MRALLIPMTHMLSCVPLIIPQHAASCRAKILTEPRVSRQMR